MTNFDTPPLGADGLPDNPERRDFLEKGTTALGASTLAAACWPYIASMNPSRDVQAKAVTQVDLTGLRAGEVRTAEWQGKPVFVFRRTDEQIADIRTSRSKIDPAADYERVQKPELLVVVGICTHLGCIPNRKGEGWMCPCHGSLYDNSGRVKRGPAPANLEVPPHHFVDEKKIIIGQV